ncbi:response regulator [Paenibacillus glycanilyticus]|uniref:response regulator n=1 Tax=Paenibacillus glycanilyticus TaxID=126569 RepID=UPI00203B62ED|nr:response regulator [Paenibacillus glycanilyticus]MCM3629830.1 response regulator [Paenibacillus glycanilyticus]
MYKVLIVDDEYYFRQALKISLPWSELGFQIAGEAKNGAEALELMPEVEPDVVLVDMNMPIMDGLEFIHKAKEIGGKTKFLVLSGHSEFAYARQAVQLGVFNYVLKPINEEELQGSLLAMKELIRTERRGELELDDLRKQASEGLSVRKEQVLNGWLRGSGQDTSESERDQLREMGIKLEGMHYRAVVVDLDPSEDRNYEDSSMPIRQAKMQEIAQRHMQSWFPCACCHDQDARLVLIIGSPEGDFNGLETICERIRLNIQNDLASTVTIGLGNGRESFRSISASYKEALIALKNRFVWGGNKVFVHSLLAETEIKAGLFSVEKRSGLLMFMRVGNLSETEEWLSRFFQDARVQKASMEMLLLAGIEIVSTCLEFLAEGSQSFEDVFRDTTQPDMIQHVQRMKTISELEDWIRTTILRAMDHVHSRKTNRAVKVIEEVKTYISRHYGNEELRIEDIARSVHMNYNHLCFVFKKETTSTINDYLTEVRIMKAKELFDQGEKVIQSVANKVGYADANYFSKCFKKQMGITPSKYVNQIR